MSPRAPRASKGDRMGSRLRVLHAYKVFFPDVRGGVPTVLDALSRLAPQRFAQTILATSKRPRASTTQDGAEVETVRSLGDALSLPVSPFYPWRLWRRLAAVDVVILHAPFPLADLVLAFTTRRARALIVYWHSHVVAQRFAFRFVAPLMRMTLKRADAIVLSHPALVYPGSILEPFREKCVFAPYAVDVDKFSPSPERASAPAREKLVVACGRLVKYKGFDILIEAAHLFEGQVVIIGEGGERAALTQKIKELGLESRVRLVGLLEDGELVALLRRADAFAFPSRTSAETFGLAQLEAMACGLPVVNTRLPTAVPELARDGAEAITVPPGDAQALGQALDRLLRDDVLRARLGGAARVRALAHYAMPVYQERMARLIESCAAGAPLPRDDAP